MSNLKPTKKQLAAQRKQIDDEMFTMYPGGMSSGRSCSLLAAMAASVRRREK